MPDNFRLLRVRIVIILSLACVVVLVINMFLYGSTHSWFSTKTPVPTPTPRPEPTATPTPRPIPHGKKGFSVSSGKKTGPQFSRGFIDPYDPASDGKQIVSVTLASVSPVVKVTAILRSDHTETSASLSLVEGVDTDGRWEGEIEYRDSYLYTYLLKIEAVDAAGEKGVVELTLR